MYKQESCKGCKSDIGVADDEPICSPCKMRRFDIQQKIVFTEIALKHSLIDRQLHENALKYYQELLKEFE